jgi:hypothetical protein
VMQWWPEEVHVAVSNGTSVVVRSTERAAELLLYEWPTEATEKQRSAQRACLRALERPEDVGPVLSARMWFRAAAEEAGILMDAPPKSLAPTSFKTPSWRRGRRN